MFFRNSDQKFHRGMGKAGRGTFCLQRFSKHFSPMVRKPLHGNFESQRSPNRFVRQRSSDRFTFRDVARTRFLFFAAESKNNSFKFFFWGLFFHNFPSRRQEQQNTPRSHWCLNGFESIRIESIWIDLNRIDSKRFGILETLRNLFETFRNLSETFWNLSKSFWNLLKPYWDFFDTLNEIEFEFVAVLRPL